MSNKITPWKFICSIIMLAGFVPLSAQAELTKLKESVVEESEEPYEDRIYYYDMALDAQGRARVVYARPKPDRQHTDVILASETETDWNKVILTPVSIYRPDATHIDVDPAGNFHITYIKNNGNVDELGNPDSDLMYLFLRPEELDGLTHGDVVIREQRVSLGGWRSQLEVGDNGQPYILREFETGFCLFTPAPEETESKLSECSVVYPGWRAQKLNLPAVNWSRLGEFLVDSAGGAHLIYGDYAYDRHGNPYQGDGTYGGADHDGYHNLWYAYSPSPEANAWQRQPLDEGSGVPTLYNWQFWVDLAVDEQNNPAVSKWLWKPGTPDRLAYDTKNLLFHKQAGQWRMNYTSRLFDASLTYAPHGPVAGMGAGLVKNAQGWHGVWDNSHPRPFEHESERGGLMYRYSPDGLTWSSYQLIAPYSGEGRSEVQLHGQQMNILVLGDHTNAKLYFLRYQLPGDNLLEVFPDRKYYYRGEPVTINARLEPGAAGDFYAVAISRARPEIQQSSEIWQLTGNLTWEKISDLSQWRPVLSFPQGGAKFTLPISQVGPGEPPFDKPDTYYDILSVVTPPGGAPLDNANWITPGFTASLGANLTIPAQ